MAESIKFQGVLEKQGRLKTWSWRKYWFVLQDDQLTYFKEEKRTSSQGLINMASAQTVREVRIGNKDFTFEIVSKTRTHVLMAQSDTLLEKWMTILTQAMDVSQLKRLSKKHSMSTSTCNSISDDEEATYSSIDEPDAFFNSDGADTDNSIILHNDLDKPVSGARESVYSDIQGSIKSQESLYQDAKRQHKDLKRLCVPSPRHAPLLRRTRLAQLEPSSSLSSGADDSTNTDCEEDSEDNSSPPLENLSVQEEMPSTYSVAGRPRSLTFDYNFAEVPDLPHPRRELVWDTPFDKIRMFLAKNRSSREFFPAHKGTFNGQHLEALRNFVHLLDSHNLDDEVFEVTSF